MEFLGGPLKGTRILCVDDDLDSLDLLRTVLIRQGAHVTTCKSAEKGVKALWENHFDVVVSDLSMPPGLDGYDLAHSLREMEDQDPARQATPTIAISGDALRPSQKRRYADFQVYMKKPLDKSRLVYIVERLVEADGEVVKLGSLGAWVAEQACQAAAVATDVAATATADAVNATVAAADATAAAIDATTAAGNAKSAASDAEAKAAAASLNAPR
jgi:CheY-like chemotaxis protein